MVCVIYHGFKGFFLISLNVKCNVNFNKHFLKCTILTDLGLFATFAERNMFSHFTTMYMLCFVIFSVLAIELLAACQGIEFLRPLKTTAPLEEVHKLVRSVVA